MALVKIRYKGLSDVRVMSKKDLADAGVGLSGELRWDARNRKTVYVDDMSERLEEILRDEGTFQVSEVKDGEDGPEEKVIVKGEALDDTGSNVVNNTDPQVAEVDAALAKAAKAKR